MDTQTLSPPESIPANDVGAGSRLLVVDDSVANSDLISRLLERRGFSVTVAMDGLQALQIIAAGNIDLVLLDVIMPGLSGIEVLKRVRVTHPATDLPIIMTTARERTPDEVSALLLGANDYVTKPLDFDLVLARVLTQLSLKRAVAQIRGLEGNLAQRNAELERANRRLVESASSTRRELEAAARIQEALLPSEPPDIPGLQCAWAFRPSEELAGDALNVYALDAQNVAMYVLDVSGHGVPASLLAVAATRLLSDARDAGSIVIKSDGDGRRSRPAGPADVALRLNRKLTLNSNAEQFLTLFYAVLNVPTRQLTYVSAGHPPAIIIREDGSTSMLESTALPVGVGTEFAQRVTQLQNGDRVFIYSDGITETMNPQRELFNAERLINELSRAPAKTLEDTISHVLSQIDAWRCGLPAKDDVSIIAIHCG